MFYSEIKIHQYVHMNVNIKNTQVLNVNSPSPLIHFLSSFFLLCKLPWRVTFIFKICARFLQLYLLRQYHDCYVGGKLNSPKSRWIILLPSKLLEECFLPQHKDPYRCYCSHLSSLPTIKQQTLHTDALNTDSQSKRSFYFLSVFPFHIPTFRPNTIFSFDNILSVRIEKLFCVIEKPYKLKFLSCNYKKTENFILNKTLL